MTAPLLSPAELASVLRERAAELGFVRVGFAKAEPLKLEGERLRSWVDKKFHGEMSWMDSTAEVRADPCHPDMLPSARTVISLAAPYSRDACEWGEIRIARYAQGRDYHQVIGKRVQRLAKVLRSRGYDARGGTDLLPIYERAWAQRAGIGFVGKNACLIVPGLGSYVFLATILTSAELPFDEPMAPRCGDCELCLQACPTDAFVGPGELDARKCISYLTIEHPGSIEPPLDTQIGPWVFGCDVCQEVCPYNRSTVGGSARPMPRAPLERSPMFDIGPEAVAQMSPPEREAWASKSPLDRGGEARIGRNIALALGNVRAAKKRLPQLG